MRNTQQIVERKVVVAGQIKKLEDELEALDTEYAEAEARESVAAGDTVSVKLGRGETAREVPEMQWDW